MRTIILAAALVALTQSASAGCFGSSSFATCFDGPGNSYTVQRFGNSTYMQGNNFRTGSRWSQRSQTFGSSTYTQGQTNGRSWNMHQQRFGSGTSYSGTDSRGNYFSGFSWD